MGVIKKGQKILDPCVGPGIFIKELLNHGIDKNQITTYDINPSFRQEIEKLDVTFTLQDTLLALFPDSYNEYDFIVGNPPYLNKASSYIRKNRLKLRGIYGKINAHETYAMFIINSIWRLKEGGKLGFITSDSFLTLSTHKKLRKFILRTCIINEILLAPKNLFSKQNVNTSPVIIILTKCSGQKNRSTRENNIIKVIPRINSENEYLTPKITKEIKQMNYNSLPFNIFFIDVEEQVIRLFEEAPRLEDYLQGFIGMHTHDNRKYIAAIKGSKLAEVFNKRNTSISELDRRFKIKSKEDLKSNGWKPYLKQGGAEQYYRPIMEALDWNEQSRTNYDIPKNVPFEEEGIVVSGVSSRLAARYMPKSCYWDSNKAIGFLIKDDSVSIPYMLGLLNSSFYNYLAKGIVNNTNSIQITGIHALPFILPDKETKNLVENLVNDIIHHKKKSLKYNYEENQKEIDMVIYNLYSKRFNFPLTLKKKLDKNFSIYKSKTTTKNKIPDSLD